MALEGDNSVAVRVIDGRTYALVTGYDSDGVQIIDITDPANPLATASAVDGEPDAAGSTYDTLAAPIHVTTEVIDGYTYALVSAYSGNGIQIINITDPSSPTSTVSVKDNRTESLHLRSPSSAVTGTIGGHTYAVVASYHSSGIQIINITDPAMPQAAAFVRSNTNDTNGDPYGSSGLPTYATIEVIGGRTYALVVTESVAQIQIIDITDPYHTLAVAHVVQSGSDDESVTPPSPKSVAAVQIEGRTFALIAGHVTDGAGINILDITDPAKPTSFGPVPFIALNTNPPRHAIWSGNATDGLNRLTFRIQGRRGRHLR